MLDWVGTWKGMKHAMHWFNVYGRLKECEIDRGRLERDLENIKLIQAEMNEKLASLQKISRIGTIRVGQDGRIIEAGPAFSEMCGYTMQEMVGLPLVELIPSRYRNRHDNESRAVFAGERPVRETPLETELRRKDGSELQVMISLSSMNIGSALVIRADVKRR